MQKRYIWALLSCCIANSAHAHHGLKHAAVEAGILSSSYSSQASTRDRHHHFAQDNLKQFAKQHAVVLKQDAAKGYGETLDTLAGYYKLKPAQQQSFNKLLQAHYQHVFADQNTALQKIDTLIANNNLG